MTFTKPLPALPPVPAEDEALVVGLTAQLALTEDVIRAAVRLAIIEQYLELSREENPGKAVFLSPEAENIWRHATDRAFTVWLEDAKAAALDAARDEAL